MNYYNPLFGAMPYTPALGTLSNTSTTRGLFSSLFSGGKLSTFINGTQKTLSLVNQAIPLIKQVSPVMKNAKTMFKVMNEFKRVEKPIDNLNTTKVTNAVTKNTNQQNEDLENTAITNTTNNNGPTFFL